VSAPGDPGAASTRRAARDPLDVAVHADGVRLPLGRAAVAEIARGVLRAERVPAAALSFTFVAPARMAALNRRHLGHRGPTDIITFELAPVPGAPRAGDVYLCPDVARENARRHGVSVREEVARLVVHGTLHVLGHEHPDDETRTGSPMWRRQEQLLAVLYRQARPRERAGVGVTHAPAGRRA
jgi:probable rRNA maturation factor